MTTLSGVQSYQNNVDMLASRTALGTLLFRDASISLHSVTGGKVVDVESGNDSNDTTATAATATRDSTIGDIITRWTLRMTVSILQWKPTARFSGISVYKVSPVPVTMDTTDVIDMAFDSKDLVNNRHGLWIVNQIDYWDSVNIVPNSGGEYSTVEKGIAISDFLIS